MKNSLPDPAQTIYRQVVNAQLGSGKSEEIAARSAWTVVGRQYKKPTEGGKWVHKKKKVKSSPLFVRRPLLNAPEVIAWAKDQGFETAQLPTDMHVTIAYSKAEVDWPEADDDIVTIVSPKGRSVEPLGEGGAVVLKFYSKALERRWQELCDHGCSYDHDSYKPHVTITWQVGDLDLAKVEPYEGLLEFGPEIHEEIDEDWQDSHTEKNKTDLTVWKADLDLGLVFGWAIICKEKGVDYYDTQNDHIPEKGMLEASFDFMSKRRTLKLMHKGEKQGEVVFAWPLTTEIAKAMGLKTNKTGLMVAVKPASNKILQAIDKGELTGFSIGGERIVDEEVED